ncbi:hypothetical protein NQ318_021271 [Aromia moschata]|uniref:Transposase n=1 Tax=Aromia moschata TaxID=1265417 RepID=A0AAV8ZCJ0_9CUCU|nr:hypothetical protein NQ318_021271 [Aromia moschata]
MSLNVLLSVQENHHASSRTLGQQHGISHSSIQKILRNHKYHPYNVQLIHELNEDDPDRRMQFSEQMLTICSANPTFLRNLIVADESFTFTLNGTVYRQNCRYWADLNPHWVMEAHTQYPQRVNVWAGIVGNRVVGPYFFEERINSRTEYEYDILMRRIQIFLVLTYGSNKMVRLHITPIECQRILPAFSLKCIACNQWLGEFTWAGGGGAWLYGKLREGLTGNLKSNVARTNCNP